MFKFLILNFHFACGELIVHEKSILLPLLPASLLALEEPLLFGWLMYYALLSMYPLLCRDRLILQYISVLALFGFIFYSPGGRSGMRANSFSIRKRALMTLPLLCSFILHVIYLSLRPPEKYPFLFEAMIVFLCCFQFVILAFYTNTKQLMLPDCSTWTERGKKDLWSCNLSKTYTCMMSFLACSCYFKLWMDWIFFEVIETDMFVCVLQVPIPFEITCPCALFSFFSEKKSCDLGHFFHLARLQIQIRILQSIVHAMEMKFNR